MGIQRWTPPGSEIDLAENGDFVLFTDHEQVVAEMTKLADGLSNALEDASLELVRLRAELAAKSKDAERYVWLKQCSREQYLMARGAFALSDEAIDEAIESEGNDGK